MSAKGDFNFKRLAHLSKVCRFFDPTCKQALGDTPRLGWQGVRVGGRRLAGFTLVELLVTISIAAIFIMLATPNFSELIKNSRISSNANELLAALQYARAEAITQKKVVTICTSDESNSSDDPECKNDVSWKAGWIIFIDQNNDGVRATGEESSETLIQVAQELSGSDLTVSGATGVDHSIRFRSDGTASNSGAISLCDDRGVTKSKSISIEQFTGRTFILTGTGICS
jgi:type IV fimbrial biogenesis protein FimT